jgi:hypothetical protein
MIKQFKAALAAAGMAALAGCTTFGMGTVEKPAPLYIETATLSNDFALVAATSRPPAGFLKMATGSTTWVLCRQSGVYSEGSAADIAKDGGVDMSGGVIPDCAVFNQPGLVGAEPLAAPLIGGAAAIASAGVTGVLSQGISIVNSQKQFQKAECVGNENCQEKKIIIKKDHDY